MSWLSFLPLRGPPLLPPEAEERVHAQAPRHRTGQHGRASLLQWALPFVQPPPPLKLLWTCCLDFLFSPAPGLGPVQDKSQKGAISWGGGEAPPFPMRILYLPQMRGGHGVLNKD